ncbi:hypothetical protein ACFYOA_22905 [Streptomyces iakyrus]|uniref:zinc finger domain-containing protein n=1 Tax=Streptomyces iakyrus TaxID=68219 RepID=UPI0036BBC9A5
MERNEIAAILAYIGRLDPRTIRTGPGEARDQITQWQELLDDVPFATDHGWDVREAIRSHILDSPYPILPVDVARKWHAHRRDRLARHTDPTPAADPDDPAAWRAELLRSRNVVAAGLAAPSTHRQLTSGGRSRDVAERLSEIGSCIPPAVRAAREAAGTSGVPDALTVRCKWCHAPAGAPCRQRRTNPDGTTKGNAVRATPHPSRIDLAIARLDRQHSA